MTGASLQRMDARSSRTVPRFRGHRVDGHRFRGAPRGETGRTPPGRPRRSWAFDGPTMFRRLHPAPIPYGSGLLQQVERGQRHDLHPTGKASSSMSKPGAMLALGDTLARVCGPEQHETAGRRDHEEAEVVQKGLGQCLPGDPDPSVLSDYFLGGGQAGRRSAG
jgi:hypothetical protein